MKKGLIILLALVMAFTMLACKDAGAVTGAEEAQPTPASEDARLEELADAAEQAEAAMEDEEELDPKSFEGRELAFITELAESENFVIFVDLMRENAMLKLMDVYRNNKSGLTLKGSELVTELESYMQEKGIAATAEEIVSVILYQQRVFLAEATTEEAENLPAWYATFMKVAEGDEALIVRVTELAENIEMDAFEEILTTKEGEKVIDALVPDVRDYAEQAGYKFSAKETAQLIRDFLDAALKESELNKKMNAFMEAMENDPSAAGDVERLGGAIYRQFLAYDGNFVSEPAEQLVQYAADKNFTLSYEDAVKIVTYQFYTVAELDTKDMELPAVYTELMNVLNADPNFAETEERAMRSYIASCMMMIFEEDQGDEILAQAAHNFVDYAGSKGFSFSEEEAEIFVSERLLDFILSVQ